MSRLFAETLFLGLKETNGRFIEFYYSSVGFELGERVTQNYEPYVCILIRYFYTEFLEARRLRVVGVTNDSIDIESAWQCGLKLALPRHCAHVGSYSEKLRKCLAAVDEYSAAYELDRVNPVGPPTDPYFSACEHFVDLVVGKRLYESFEKAVESGVVARDTQEHFAVFDIAKDIFVVIKGICVASAKAFDVNDA